MEVKDIFKNLREKNHLTQSQMAERVMVTRQLVCQCCGMPLSEDGLISHEPDGSYNEDYCKWCYADGEFAYKSKDSLLDYLVGHMPNPDNLSDDNRRNQFDLYLMQLKHWK